MTKARSNATAEAAKGDLRVGNGTNLSGILAVGSNGDTIVADSSTATGLRYQTGVSLNGIINGGMDIWQRGTSFASTGNLLYTADRWGSFRPALGQTVSRQTASLEGFQYSLRSQRDSGNTSTAINYVFYSMETNDSVRYANKPVTLSFWAKVGANYSSVSSLLSVQWTTGTGTDQTIINGYTGSANIANTTATLTTSWQRFSFTGTAASNTNEMGVVFYNVPVGTAGANDWFEITGVQIELGSVPTNFKRAGGTIQGELAACQRYYYRAVTNGMATTWFSSGFAFNTTRFLALVKLPVRMRVNPTSIETSGTAAEYRVLVGATIGTATAVPTLDTSNWDNTLLNVDTTGLTAGQGGILGAATTNNAYIGFNAEL